MSRCLSYLILSCTIVYDASTNTTPTTTTTIITTTMNTTPAIIVTGSSAFCLTTIVSSRRHFHVLRSIVTSPVQFLLSLTIIKFQLLQHIIFISIFNFILKITFTFNLQHCLYLMRNQLFYKILERSFDSEKDFNIVECNKFGYFGSKTRSDPFFFYQRGSSTHNLLNYASQDVSHSDFAS